MATDRPVSTCQPEVPHVACPKEFLGASEALSRIGETAWVHRDLGLRVRPAVLASRNCPSSFPRSSCGTRCLHLGKQARNRGQKISRGDWQMPLATRWESADHLSEVYSLRQEKREPLEHILSPSILRYRFCPSRDGPDELRPTHARACSAKSSARRAEGAILCVYRKEWRPRCGCC
jgi:hypothetical protein